MGYYNYSIGLFKIQVKLPKIGYLAITHQFFSVSPGDTCTSILIWIKLLLSAMDSYKGFLISSKDNSSLCLLYLESQTDVAIITCAQYLHTVS